MKTALIVFAIIIALVLIYAGLRQLFSIGPFKIDLTLTPEDIYRKDEPVDMALTQGRTPDHAKRNENTAINCMIIIVILAIAAASYFALN